MRYFTTTLFLLVSLAGFGQITVDFTDPATPTYGTDAQKNENGVMMMWGGDANGDGFVRAKGRTLFPSFELLPSDRDVILNSGLQGNVEGELMGYYNWDVNLDGFVRAKGRTLFPSFELLPSDRDVILNKVLLGNVEGEKKVDF